MFRDGNKVDNKKHLNKPDELINHALVLLKAGRDKSPLFLVHPIYGNTACYPKLVKYLDNSRLIYGLEPQPLRFKLGSSHLKGMAIYYR